MESTMKIQRKNKEMEKLIVTIFVIVFFVGFFALMFIAINQYEEEKNKENKVICESQNLQHLKYSDKCYEIIDNRIVKYQIEVDNYGNKFVSAYPILSTDEK